MKGIKTIIKQQAIVV